MRSMNAVQMAEQAISTSNATIIVIDVANGGSSSRWAQAFPSLDAAAQAKLDDGATFLSFGSWLDAAARFERLTADCAEHAGRGVIMVGAITLVCRPFDEDDGTETHAWELDDDSRPVFRDLTWTREAITDRI